MTDKIETTEEMNTLHKTFMEAFMGSSLPPDVKVGIMSNVLGRALVTNGFNLNSIMDVMRDNVRQGISESIMHVARAEMEADALKHASVKQD